jgi:hypothetical protein
VLVLVLRTREGISIYQLLLSHNCLLRFGLRFLSSGFDLDVILFTGHENDVYLERNFE